MTKYLAGVLSVIAAGVLLIAYGLLAPQASATFNGNDRFGMVQAVPPGYGAPMGYGTPVNGYAYPAYPAYQYQAVPAAGVAPQAVPVNMVVGQPLARPVVYDDVAPARRVTSAAPAPRRVTSVERAPRRDWKKTAMVIGGSSATGAGLGALIGGKKGALVGAAIGGGASTLWETTRK